MTESARQGLARVQAAAVVAGVVGLALCALGFAFSRQFFFESWLVGFVFWVGVSLGCGAIVMLHHVTGGRWGDAIEGALESGLGTLPLMAAAFVPVAAGLGSLYLWAQPQAVKAVPLLQEKAKYLNVPRFLALSIISFALWLAGAFFLLRWGDLARRTGDPRYARRLLRLSAGGLIIYVLTTTFTSIDWVMSLEPRWYSSIYGFIFIAGQGLIAFALGTIVYALLGGEGGVDKKILHDLGNFLLMAVAFWSYIQFSQFLIIYYGNLPEEVSWYIPRTQGVWGKVALALILFHFCVPLAVLLSRHASGKPRAMLIIAGGLAVMHFVALLWMAVPAFARDRWWPVGLDVAAWVGIGGFWVALFLGILKRRSPRMAAASMGGHAHGA